MARGLENVGKLQKRLRALRSRKAEKLLEGALHAGADMIASEAKHSITRNSTSGQVGGKHQHVRSLPGQAPNNEFGDLAGGIEVNPGGPLEYVVTAEAAHSVPLEFGSSKMAARPFFRPARDKKKREARKLWEDTVKRILNGAAG